MWEKAEPRPGSAPRAEQKEIFFFFPREASTRRIQGTPGGVGTWPAGEQTYLDVFFTVSLLVEGQLTL